MHTLPLYCWFCMWRVKVFMWIKAYMCSSMHMDIRGQFVAAVFFPSNKWVYGMQIRSSGLAASGSTQQSHLISCTCILYMILSLPVGHETEEKCNIVIWCQSKSALLDCLMVFPAIMTITILYIIIVCYLF